MKKLKLNVNMHCKSCNVLIKDVLDEMGVSDVKFLDNYVFVNYDDSIIKEKEIRQSIESEGYIVK